MPRRPRHRPWWQRLLVLLVVGVGVAGWLTYSYATDGRFLADEIHRMARLYLPGGGLKIEKIQIRPFLGQVELRHAVVNQRVGDQTITAFQVPWIHIRMDLATATQGIPTPREIVLTQPKIRLKRRSDGTWNLQGLIADPWPGPLLPTWPVLRIHKGIVELHDEAAPVTVLHDVTLRLEPTQGDWLWLEGESQGDFFQRITFAGWIHGITGDLILTQGELRGLVLEDELRSRLPERWGEALASLGSFGGRADISVRRLEYRPGQAEMPRHDLEVTLREATWDCPQIPFPLAGLSAHGTLIDGELSIARAEGRFGETILRVLAGSRLSLGDFEQGPFDVKLQALDLELDERIFERLPTESQALWRSIQPKGRTSLGRAGLVLLARRASAGQPIELSLELDCQDVSIQPVAFPYCFEHVRGKVRWAEGKVELALRTVIGGQPLTAAGSIVDPAGKPRAALEFAFGTLPIDQALLDALPADARQIVRDFQPAGTIHGSGRVVLDPEFGPEPRVSAALSLDGVREMRWSGMRYPVRKLSGRLLIEPESWTFEELRGENGHARLAASGQVDVLAPGQFAVDLRVIAQHLKFDRELRDALPRPWQWSWGILNPVGSSNVEAHVVVRPGQEDQYRIRITPDNEDETRLHLALTPVPGSPGSASGRLQLPPMEQVRGTFDFDNGAVRMQDVTFTFREAPVRFGRGEVVLKESGEFDLKIRQLGLRKLRLDAALRRIMPGMMGGFAELLDDGKGFTARAELLGISWSGNPLEPAVCTWDQATVDFLDNTIKAGVPLEQLQGRISGISGSSDGRQITTQGLIELDNVVIENQQLTEVRSPIVVADGWVRLSRIEAMLLGGTLEGALAMRFEDTPSFQGGLTLRDASLDNLARTLPGRQDFTGRFSGWLDVSGRGSDLRSLRGRGGARVLEADLGQLPVFLRLIKPLNLSREKSAFDRADVSFTIEDGLFALDPIKFTGNTISLQGRGTIDPSGELEARFMPLYGRDERMHIPGISDVTREASGQILAIQARGPITSPQFKLEVAPTAQRMAGQMARFLTGDRDNDAPRPPAFMPRGPISEMVAPRR